MDRTHDDELRAAAFVTFLEQCELATQRWHLPLSGATITLIARTCTRGRDCAHSILRAWGGRAWPARERVLAMIWRTIVCRWTMVWPITQPHGHARLVEMYRAPSGNEWVAPLVANTTGACIWWILVFANDDTELAVRLVVHKSPYMRVKPRSTRSRYGTHCAEIAVPVSMMSAMGHIEFMGGNPAVERVFVRMTPEHNKLTDAYVLHNKLAVWLMEYRVLPYCDKENYVTHCHWRDILAARYQLLRARHDYLVATGRGDVAGAPMRAWQACDTSLRTTGTLHDNCCGTCARYLH